MSITARALQALLQGDPISEMERVSLQNHLHMLEGSGPTYDMERVHKIVDHFISLFKNRVFSEDSARLYPSGRFLNFENGDQLNLEDIQGVLSLFQSILAEEEVRGGPPIDDIRRWLRDLEFASGKFRKLEDSLPTEIAVVGFLHFLFQELLQAHCKLNYFKEELKKIRGSAPLFCDIPE
jgi:hypothetical protein